MSFQKLSCFSGSDDTPSESTTPMVFVNRFAWVLHWFHHELLEYRILYWSVTCSRSFEFATSMLMKAMGSATVIMPPLSTREISSHGGYKTWRSAIMGSHKIQKRPSTLPMSASQLTPIVQVVVDSQGRKVSVFHGCLLPITLTSNLQYLNGEYNRALAKRLPLVILKLSQTLVACMALYTYDLFLTLSEWAPYSVKEKSTHKYLTVKWV